MVTALPLQASHPPGTLLRWSTTADTADIATLCEVVFCEDPRLAGSKRAQIERLMDGDHPLMSPGDFAIAVDETLRARGECPLVSCIALIKQDVAYEGVEFTLGRPDNVATRKGYRRKGLVRRLMEMVHARCEAEGILMLAIAGINHFYRQFGYEYALSLGGQTTTLVSMLPPLKDDAEEPYPVRAAIPSDVPFIHNLIDTSDSKYMLHTVIDPSTWLYYLSRPSSSKPKNFWDIYIVLNASTRTPCGVLCLWNPQWHDTLDVRVFEFVRDANLPLALPSVARQLIRLSHSSLSPTSPTKISWSLGASHRVYDILNRPGIYPLAAIHTSPYAWFVRIPSLAHFLAHVTPALERRIAASEIFASYTGSLRVHFYGSPGFRLDFWGGRLVRAEDYEIDYTDASAPEEQAAAADAKFPPMVFWKCVMGYRSIEEVLYMYPDAGVLRVETRGLLDVLFPKKESCLRVLPM